MNHMTPNDYTLQHAASNAQRSLPSTDPATRINNCDKDIAFRSSSSTVVGNEKKCIFHMRAPYQLEIFKNSPFAKATPSSEYRAQYTTCGWVAAYLAHHLCKILSQDSALPKEGIQAILSHSIPDMFIRNASRFVGDLTPYGGSADKVEGLVLGEDIYAILKGTHTPALENVFVLEGATEESALKTNGGVIEVFNAVKSFRGHYKDPAHFFPLTHAIREVAAGKKPFMVLVSLETFPLGAHFITYAFRMNAQAVLECLIFEGLNEMDNNWVLLEPSRKHDTIRRVTTEWIYSDLGIPSSE